MSRNTARQTPSVLNLEILGRRVRVELSAPELLEFVVANFGVMRAGDHVAPPSLNYLVQPDGVTRSMTPEVRSRSRIRSPSDLLYALEKDITVELQKQRPDLFFLHSAAVEWRGKAYLLAAESGSGKSTTTWALLHHGFGYLSDELSPVDLRTLTVLPYPHALSLKRPPPAYPLPTSAMHLGRTIHVPVHDLPGRVVTQPIPIGGVFLVRYSSEARAPVVARVSAATGAAHMYTTALNALAHRDAGLAAVAHIAESVPCFALTSAHLPETCTLLRSVVEQLT